MLNVVMAIKNNVDRICSETRAKAFEFYDSINRVQHTARNNS